MRSFLIIVDWCGVCSEFWLYGSVETRNQMKWFALHQKQKLTTQIQTIEPNRRLNLASHSCDGESWIRTWIDFYFVVRCLYITWNQNIFPNVQMYNWTLFSISIIFFQIKKYISICKIRAHFLRRNQWRRSSCGNDWLTSVMVAWVDFILSQYQNIPSSSRGSQRLCRTSHKWSSGGCTPRVLLTC